MDNLWETEQKMLEAGIQKMNLSLPKDAPERLVRFVDLLWKENQRMNLTGYQTKEEIIRELILDALSALPFLKGNKIIDVGTGGGIPGIPIGIACPHLSVTLIESHRKKIQFLQRAIQELSLPGVSLQHGRSEELARQENLREQFHTVTAKALAPLAVALELTIPFVRVGGRGLYYKGKGYSEDLLKAREALRVLSCVVEEVVEVSIPFGDRKTHLVVIQKETATPPYFPRKVGLPQRKPL
ncbi:MAG: 16S rRNA (guanine(527)-N(7))-methyltransferase RsmG [Candidatus Caldatribacteriaceae bacterium]